MAGVRLKNIALPIQSAVRNVTILEDGSGRPVNIPYTMGHHLNFENKESPIPFKAYTRDTFHKYKYPTYKFQYTKEDVVQHALSVGIKGGDKYAENYINPDSKNLKVLPTFLFPINNKLLVDMGQTGNLLSYRLALHGEHFVEVLRPMEPEGIVTLTVENMGCLDKIKGTLYFFGMQAFNENSELLSKYEYSLYEVGTGGFTLNSKEKQTENLKGIMAKFVEFDTSQPISKTYQFRTPDNLPESKDEESIYSNTALSFYAGGKLGGPTNCHGRYYFAEAIKSIFMDQMKGDLDKFKSAKVRFSSLVYPGDCITVRTWIKGNKIHFDGLTDGDNKQNIVMKGGCVEVNE